VLKGRRKKKARRNGDPKDLQAGPGDDPNCQTQVAMMSAT